MGWPMDESDWLTLRFEENRTHLRAVAYQMLGSLSDADDAVQETWLRLSRSDPSNIGNLGGWLTTVTARCGWTCCARADCGARSRSACTCPTRS
jgi:DNA-directed RNA polymerase specialized sigma24 family protein